MGSAAAPRRNSVVNQSNAQDRDRGPRQDGSLDNTNNNNTAAIVLNLSLLLKARTRGFQSMNGVGESLTEIEKTESPLIEQGKTMAMSHPQLNLTGELIAAGGTVIGRARARAGHPTTPLVAIEAEVLTAK